MVTEIEREVDRSHMQVSDEVAIQITGMNKWYGAFHVLKDINLTVNRGERIYPDPLYQPPRGASGRVNRC